MKTTMLIAALLLSTTANAQVRKCTGPDGKITYSDFLCGDATNAVKGISQEPPQDKGKARQSSQPSYYEQEVTRKVVGYLSSNDVAGASRMAVTPEHFQMIEDHKRMLRSDEAETRAAKQAAKPTVCKTTGFSTQTDHGLSTSSGIYSGKTVCSK